MAKRARGVTSGEFFRFLRRRKGEAADRKMADRTEREITLFVSDSSGFTRRTHEHGILHFLSLLIRVYDRVVPRLRKHGGRVLVARADNILALFEDPAGAVAAAVEVQKLLARDNRRKREADRFNLCIGIHSGRAFVLKDDVYGACVNVASKLGEDLAGKDEILVTGEVARQVKGRFRTSYVRSAVIGARPFELHRISCRP